VLDASMDVSTLDDYLCAVLSGPNMIMPSEWMRWIWHTENGQQSPTFRGANFAVSNLLSGSAAVCVVSRACDPESEKRPAAVTTGSTSRALRGTQPGQPRMQMLAGRWHIFEACMELMQTTGTTRSTTDGDVVLIRYRHLYVFA
jgi:hypothetical protein